MKRIQWSTICLLLLASLGCERSFAIAGGGCNFTDFLSEAEFSKIYFSNSTVDAERNSVCTIATKGAKCSDYFSSQNYGAVFGPNGAFGNVFCAGELAKANLSTLDKVKVVAEFFGHSSQETTGGNVLGTKWQTGGLMYSFYSMSEGACYQSAGDANGSCGDYGQWWGRGPKQLTYKANYQWFANLNIGGSSSVVTSPGDLITKPQLGWISGAAYQFYNRPQPSGGYIPAQVNGMIPSLWKQTPYATNPDYGSAGFGETINLINPLECSPSEPGYAQSVAATGRGLVRVESLTRINGFLEMLLRLDSSNSLLKVVISEYDQQTKTFSSKTYTHADMLKNMGKSPLEHFPLPGSLYTDGNGITVTSKLVPAGVSASYSYVPGIVTTPPDGADFTVGGRYTGISSVVAYYKDGTEERLDCTGYKSPNDL